MSPFKRNLVESILKCQCVHESHQKRKGLEKLNVFQQHMVHLCYNVETQLINLKNASIKIICQTEDKTEENGLLCTKCNFKISQCPKMEKLMYEHVLSKHLNAYQCPHSEKTEHENYHKYYMHIKKCKWVGISKVDCDICGKSSCDSRTLQNHKWTHMNDQEKKEALETGLVKKYPRNKFENKEQLFRCEQCVKSFSTKHTLQKHRNTHKERNSREQFICPKCGRSFLNTGQVINII